MIEEQKFNFGKTFLLGFGFFAVMVAWSVYNAFVPLFLQTASTSTRRRSASL